MQNMMHKLPMSLCKKMVWVWVVVDIFKKIPFRSKNQHFVFRMLSVSNWKDGRDSEL